MTKKQAKKEKNRELTESLQRLQADFENFKKQTDKQREQIVTFAEANVIKAFLPVVDAFEHAMTMGKNSSDEFRKGIELIHTQLKGVMKSLQITPIKAVGEKLDPHRHDVMIQEEKEDIDDDTITQELQRGYMLHHMVLRHSKVKIAKRKDKEKKSNKAAHEDIKESKIPGENKAT
jgi:molecular chaperone GrpE